jgi:Fur family ferric uptake transcriptional regulator
MDKIRNTLELHLKSAGYSLTSPRHQVFDILQQHGPLSMQELYNSLRGRVNRTTVYRVIALFEELNIAQRVAKGWKYKLELTDAFIPHHHHFTCTHCHRTISFDEPKSFDAMLDTIAHHNGFSPTGHTLEIEGLCSNCRAAS